MREQELQDLLYRRESESLDFKRDQYEFVRGALDKKAELLKDVLAMANSWRQEPAHILIGVEELPQGKARVVGIPLEAHLDDHSLQQFVNLKTNRPVLLSYERLETGGLHVGVIRLEHLQERPIYLVERFGPLSQQTVYIRRGSATDQASPEEIFAMGRAQVAAESQPAILLEIADPVREGHSADAAVTCRKLVIQPPRVTSEPGSQGSPMSREILRAITGLPGAEEDWKKKAARITRAAALSPVRLWTLNDSPVNAVDVRVRIDVPKQDGLLLIPESKHPKWTQYPNDLTGFLHNDPHVNETERGWRVESETKKLQPRSEHYSGQFFIRADHDMAIDMSAQIFADNLRTPITCTVRVTVSTKEENVEFREAEEILKQLTD